MNHQAIKLLEFDKIKSQLKEFAYSAQGKILVEKLMPSVDIRVIEAWMKETTEACAILERSASVPIHSLTDMDTVIGKLGKGISLQPDDLTVILELLREIRKLKRFMSDKEVVAPTVSSYALSLFDLQELSEEIDRCIQNGRVSDKASPQLAKTRKQLAILEDRIKSKLENMLRSASYSRYLQDSVISTRNGRFVIPVKKEYRKQVEGTVMDSSASGSTLFIEPAEICRLQDELNQCKIAEEQEEYRILSQLTGLVEASQRELSINMEVMAHYDFLFAKAKYSRSIDGTPAFFNDRQLIRLTGAKHPLIGKQAVPLDFHIGDTYRTLVITGPNTGGKTVSLKTVGLLALMAQCGLHIPAAPGSEMTVFTDILADIGDGQSIEQSLSTFSSHIRNIISIMACAGRNTLVIIDELGAGTDPGEGMGLAISILEAIHRKGATSIITTHYSEIKSYASQWEGFANGCMEFDIDTLQPLYRLKIGAAGESNAFLIALRLGMSKAVIERAHEYTYKEKKDYDVFHGIAVCRPEKNDAVAIQHAEQLIKTKKAAEVRKTVEQAARESAFKVGDCVFISSMNRTGIICEPEDSKGEVGVMVMRKKLKINRKRLALHIEGKELYPENYDFDIIFESKDNRKKRKILSKRHEEGLTIELEK